MILSPLGFHGDTLSPFNLFERSKVCQRHKYFMNNHFFFNFYLYLWHHFHWFGFRTSNRNLVKGDY